jgi:hypothetical protein
MADIPCSANADRNANLFCWALGVLQRLGFEQAVAQAATVEELRAITLDSKEAAIALEIRDALHPANGRRDKIFVGLREGSLKSILRNRFNDLKRDREKTLRDAPPLDPSVAQLHPFDNPAYTPADLVHGIALKYLFMDPFAAVRSWAPALATSWRARN